ncbi:hybrid D-mandelate dehydrogenase-like dehydrogenase/2OG-Fe(II) oxygenase [Aspergillus vadensis CBS 113365]|uniref:Fe2OG dioxygenase domain-containing protein n=1 Tax=Aspergillus vadensis (strain CBS 113365 / IMI 142717 / IBT 24658) TaxID=1448311 RepID=A0A319CLF8_ASPVC|nr:hypothetical protein BO88DRAFT_388396 [Aspergillus vadensis CBS 113365]PYH69162.1 hypothetical protein BO88DRAFT_388396 [Aspergillus vadensis CBS 113365]
MPAALLIGAITHSIPEWNDLSSILTLKEFPSGTREDFLRNCRDGQYDDVVAIYRSNTSTKFTGPFDAELVSVLPSSLKYIAHNGAGYDNIDVAACTKKGIAVSSTPVAVNNATADVAIFLMIGALRQAYIPVSSLREGKFLGQTGLGHDPQNKVLGILGMGGIGREVARRARAFGMTIQYHNRSRLSPELEDGATYVSFDELLANADVLSLNLALNASTRHIIGKSEFQKMKDGVIIVNTARGALIDEKALVEALESGKVWSAGLDVYENEPAIEPGLVNNPRVMLLPHIGTMTYETQREMELLVLNNLRSGVETGKMITLDASHDPESLTLQSPLFPPVYPILQRIPTYTLPRNAKDKKQKATPQPGPRPDLCDALPWFRSVQGGVYHNGNICWGFLIDADCGIRSYLDDEVVITRVGGGCTKDANGNLVLIKDQDGDSAAMSSILNSMELKVPVGIVIGNRNTLLPRSLPHRYNVMAYFRITHVWYERIGRRTGAKVRFEKLDLGSKSWWAAKHSRPPLERKKRDYAMQAEQARCEACDQYSIRIYDQGWMCLQPSCKLFWMISGSSSEPTDLTFHEKFLKSRLPPDPTIQPHYSLVPDLLSTLKDADSDALSKRITWKGIICPLCKRCISRRYWWGWRCADDDSVWDRKLKCPFEHILPIRPIALRWVIDDMETSPIKRALSWDAKFMVPEVDDVSLYPYRKLTYTIPGVGSIMHLVANREINTRRNGPDELFGQLQCEKLGLRRYPLAQSVVAGTLTAHFAVNYGMPYKYVVSVSSKSFNEACPPILRAMGRLTWASKQAHLATGDTFLPPNEMLLLGYLEDMRIGYHDDGESSLGPTISTLSLGAKSTMLVRMKYKYYHGYSRAKKLLEEDPVLPGCKNYLRRRELKAGLLGGSIDREGYDELRREGLSMKKGGTGGGGEATPCIKMEVNHGDLVVMHGEGLQKFFEHSVIPDKRLRFALTARYIKPESVGVEEMEKGRLELGREWAYDGK